VTPELEIQAMVDRETSAWDRQDAESLVELFHPDMVWPWSPDAGAHDPVSWVFLRGVSTARGGKRGGRGGFAVVDVDTLWRRRSDGQSFEWKGRACKGYTKVGRKWLLIFHTGLLEYEGTRGHPTTG
jgi:hypothetical protein